MAAFTTFSKETLERHLKMFRKGKLIDHSPIAKGIDNSNYFIELEKDGEVSDFVLTILESHNFSETPFFAKLLSHLHHYGLPVPEPQSTLDGMTYTIFCGKPSLLVTKLSGRHIRNASVKECQSIGQFLATQHKAMNELKSSKPNFYSVEWMTSTVLDLGARLSKEDSHVLNETIEIYDHVLSEDLPTGIIHGDLFKDNALFDAGILTGVIDYYRACEDLLAIDIAIAINDWCRDEQEFDESKRNAMISGYNAIRPLSESELRHLVDLQQVSAARFALTRMLSGVHPLKDPEEMLLLVRSLDEIKR